MIMPTSRPSAAGHRLERDLLRGRQAAERVRATGGSALVAALAHVEATFGTAMGHAIFKDRVAAYIALGAGHAEVRTRYRAPIERHPVTTLGGAIALIERLRHAEIEARDAAIRSWGHCSRPRFALMILDELRLILRVVRRWAPSRYTEFFSEISATDPGLRIADDETLGEIGNLANSSR